MTCMFFVLSSVFNWGSVLAREKQPPVNKLLRRNFLNLAELFGHCAKHIFWNCSPNFCMWFRAIKQITFVSDSTRSSSSSHLLVFAIQAAALSDTSGQCRRLWADDVSGSADARWNQPVLVAAFPQLTAACGHQTCVHQPIWYLTSPSPAQLQCFPPQLLLSTALHQLLTLPAWAPCWMPAQPLTPKLFGVSAFAPRASSSTGGQLWPQGPLQSLQSWAQVLQQAEQIVYPLHMCTHSSTLF